MAAYLSRSGAIQNIEPDFTLPESELGAFQYSAPNVIQKLQAGVDNFDNTAISGIIRTNDNSDSPSILFVTAYRSGPDDGAQTSHFYDGYGIAIRPNPEGEFGEFNVFIVDNSIGPRNVVLEKVIHTGWGDYAYLAATTTTLNYNQDYNFNLEFGPNGQLEFYLWEINEAEPVQPIISHGAYQHQSSGSYWGIGASPTNGKHWYIDRLDLYATDSRYALSYYKLSTADMIGSVTAKAYAMGAGYEDGVAAPSHGIEMFAYDFLDREWKQLDSHSAYFDGSSILLSSSDLSISRYGDGSTPSPFIHLIITSQYPSNYSSNINSKIHVDYVFLENWSSNYVHVGGKADVYVRETAGLTTSYLDLLNASLSEYLIPDNDKISNDFYLPILWVKSVELLDISGEPTGTHLTPNLDWAISYLDTTTRYSSVEEPLLTLASAGWSVRVHYYTIPNIQAAQDYCDELDRKNATDDLLIKSAQPCEVFVEGTFSGDALSADLVQSLASWINETNSSSISITDINVYLQSLDYVVDANIDAFTIKTHKRDGSTDTYSISSGSIDIDENQQFVAIADTDHIQMEKVN